MISEREKYAAVLAAFVYLQVKASLSYQGR
ncbi:hypothetical protein PKDLPJHF_02838 [Aeromonas veronii]